MCGPPGEIRTPDTQVRSLVLYPAELRAEARSLIFSPKKVKVMSAQSWHNKRRKRFKAPFKIQKNITRKS